MISVILTAVRSLRRAFMPRCDLVLENLALRPQLSVLSRQVARPSFHRADRLLWVALRAVWSRWIAALVIVQPQTVVRWHRAGFRLYWRWRSRHRDGRPPIDHKLIELIRQRWTANPTWGSPRIRDELAKLGLNVSASTIRRYRPKFERPSSQTWQTFLRNHAAQIIAVDFFTVPTATFRVLFVFVVLARCRRTIRRIAITETPTAGWAAQQVVEALPFEPATKYLLRDRDGIYGVEKANAVTIILAGATNYKNWNDITADPDVRCADYLQGVVARSAAGSVRGLRARGGIAVALSWSGGKLASAELQTKYSGPCRLRTPGKIEIRQNGAPVALRPVADGVIEFTAAAGATYAIAPRTE
jgi:hypothetical protein